MDSCKGCGVAGTKCCEACSGWLPFETVEFRISKDRNMEGVQGESVELWWWDRRVCWDQGIQMPFDSYQEAIRFVKLLNRDWADYNAVMNKTVDEELDYEDEGAINDWLYDLTEQATNNVPGK